MMSPGRRSGGCSAPPPRRRPARGRRRSAVLAVVAAAAACSSGDRAVSPTSSLDGATPAPSATAAPTEQPPTTEPATGPVTEPPTTGPTTPPTTSPVTPPSTGGAATPGEAAGAGELSADDVAAIRAAFVLFFGGQASTVDEKVAVLEDGERYRDMLEGAAADERFQQLTTDIREIRGGSPAECSDLSATEGCAVVVHDLLVSGFPMAAEVASPAIRVPGGWQVGWRAWCNVVEIGGAACPAQPEQGPATP